MRRPGQRVNRAGAIWLALFVGACGGEPEPPVDGPEPPAEEPGLPWPEPKLLDGSQRCSAPVSFHAWVTLPPEQRLAVDESGNAFLVWPNCSPPAAGNMQVIRFAQATGTWSPPEAIGSNQGDKRPLIAAGPAGTFLVAWATGNHVTQWENAIWANNFRPATGWGMAVEIATGSDLAPLAVGFHPDGSALALWRDLSGYFGLPPIPPGQIGGRSLSDAGWGPASFDTSALAVLRAAVASTGEALLVGRSGDLWALRFDAMAGFGALEPLPVSASDGNAPAIGVDGAGDALVLWAPPPATAAAGRPLSSRSVGGRGWGEPALVGAAAAGLMGPAERPVVAMNAKGDALAAWSAAGPTLWASRYVASMGTWEVPRRLEVAPHGSPMAALDDQGNGLLVWSRLDGGGAPVALSGARFDGRKGWRDGWARLASPAKAGAIRPEPVQAVADGLGGFFLTWTQDELHIWANRLPP